MIVTIPLTLCFCLHQMNDVMLYTYPQQDGKYRLKNTLYLSGMKVSPTPSYWDDLPWPSHLTPDLWLCQRVFLSVCVLTAVLCVLFSQVSIPVINNVLNALRIEVSDVTITLSARWVKAEDTCLGLCTRLVHWLDTVFMYICIIICTASTHICFCVHSSCGEREDWFHTLSRAIADHAAGLCTFGGPCSEVMSSPLNDSVQDIPLKLTCIKCNVWNV